MHWTWTVCQALCLYCFHLTHILWGKKYYFHPTKKQTEIYVVFNAAYTGSSLRTPSSISYATSLLSAFTDFHLNIISSALFKDNGGGGFMRNIPASLTKPRGLSIKLQTVTHFFSIFHEPGTMWSAGTSTWVRDSSYPDRASLAGQQEVESLSGDYKGPYNKTSSAQITAPPIVVAFSLSKLNLLIYKI